MFRKCTKDYTIPNTSIKLKKGQPVCVSLVGMHNDPEYYPNPEKFDPERFTEENKRSRPPFTFMPFGEGPRICIGKLILFTHFSNLNYKFKDYVLLCCKVKSD